MSTQDNAPLKAQMDYATLLFWGAWIGMGIMTVTYLMYMLGIGSPHIPLHEVTGNWGQGLHHFVEVTGSPTGWDWLALIGKADYMNFVGLAILALITILCYLPLIPAYLKSGDTIYAVFAALEVVVLTVAASGVLGSGGH